jgi:predicted RNA-binding protein with PIN domain
MVGKFFSWDKKFVPDPWQTRQHGGRPGRCQSNPPDFDTMTRPFLLIDAHNVIFARPELAALHRRNPAAAREELVRLLERHQDASGVRVVAVFDGGTTARPTNEKSGPAGIQIFYPQSGQTADAIIERLVLKYAATHRLTVATNDHLIRTAAIAAGAATMDAETLFDEIQHAERELAGQLARLRRKK